MSDKKIMVMNAQNVGDFKSQMDPLHQSFDLFDYPFSQEIWAAKYSNNGKDADHHATFFRVAQAIASIEDGSGEDGTPRMAWEESFYRAMTSGCFMPAGRILAGAGTENLVTLVNCFVNQTVPDSMDGIMDALKDTALTMQQGGGMGTDFSTLRPEHAALKRTGSSASGPMPFMDTWDANCKTIMSAGSRRGAMMGTMICTHPDLLKFIEAKHDGSALRMFNVSVLVTDKFMHAVRDDAPWVLYFNKPPIWVDERPEDLADCDFKDKDGVWQYAYAIHPAREIWDKIIKSTFEYAEPGVIFIDRVNGMNNLQYLEHIMCTNPCGEQPLPPYGACNLGAINLARMVMLPFTEDAHINETLLIQTIKVAMRFLDNVIDVSRYPLPEQKAEQELKRRVGLGIAGYADMLIQLGIRYGSTDAEHITNKLGKMFVRAQYLASIELAAERGPFPGYHAEYLNSNFLGQALDDDVIDAIKEHGIRNGVCGTIAPTGTTSIFFGNLAGGLEPNFAFEYNRKVLQNDDSWKEQKVESFISRFADHCGYPPVALVGGHIACVTATDLNVREHLHAQAIWQQYIDASISKTINCPVDIAYEDFKEVYWSAWSQGCKGCTTYKPSEARGSILSAIEDAIPIEDADIEYQKEGLIAPEPMTRPESLDGTTYKLKWPTMASSIYMTVNSAPNGRPFEVFFMSKNNKHQEWMTALSLTMTSLFRLQVDASFIFAELQQIKGNDEVAWVNGTRHDSLIAYIGAILDEHINGIPTMSDAEWADASKHDVVGEECPSCGEPSMYMSGGCMTCTSCGHSKCG